MHTEAASKYWSLVAATGGGTVYAPNRPETVAEELATLLADRNKLNELAENGYNAVRENFSIEQSAGRLISLYEAVIHGE